MSIAKTLHDRYCIGLEALGCHRLPPRNKFTMYQADEGGTVFFVGRAGALRKASRANAAMSRPCTDKFKEYVLNANSTHKLGGVV